MSERTPSPAAPSDSESSVPKHDGAAPNPLDECSAVIASIKTKADKNKTRARWSATILTGTTAAIPLCLIVAEAFEPDSSAAFLSGRLAPGFLAAVAAVLARWIQIEQPHQRWTLYRRWQRLFEAERLRYSHQIGRYSSSNRDELLAEVLAQGQLDLDDEWASLIPRSRELAESAQTEPQ